jgi:phosphoglycerate kinase
MNKLTIRDVDIAGKRVFVRVDFNVPIDEKTGAITDDGRIRAVLPTIKYLLEQKTRIILCSHLGRPDGKVVESQRLTGVAKRLSHIVNQPVDMARDCVGPDVEQCVANMKPGQILMLENVRFHQEEEDGVPSFAQALSRLGDIYVNDAFAVSHRCHASIVGITNYLPAVAGMLLEKELDTLGRIIEDPAHPFAALVGGAKVGDKVDLLENILKKVDFVLVGGGMAATFLKAESYEIGKSIVENDHLQVAADLMNRAKNNGAHFILPLDVIVTEEITPDAKATVVPVNKIQPNQRIVDIGPETIKEFTKTLCGCETVFWNGPMGIFEIPQFSEGTRTMANTIAGLKGTTVIGGGSTAEIVASLKLGDKMSLVSTGGGASLQYLGGQRLPGVEALLDKDSTAAAQLKARR